MSEVPQEPVPTTVVGYPGTTVPPVTGGYASPGVASLRSQVRTVRALVVACLALLLVLAVGLGIGFATSQARLADLSDQVSALSKQVAAAAPAETSQAQAQGQPQAQAQQVTQLGEAPDLPAGTTIPTGADTTGAILIGDPQATDVVEVYVDYQCPFCQRWEAQVGSALVQRALQPDSGLLVKQYNLAFLGETSATLSPAGASARAASAAACILDADGPQTFAAFNSAVFAAADPSEPKGQFPVDVLSGIATKAGASPEALACISAEQNVPFVAATTQAGFGRGVGGTPTVIVNGRTLGNPFTDAELAALASSG